MAVSTAPVPRAGEILRSPTHLLAFGFGAGLSPVAPGTAGTLVGVALYLLINEFPPPVYWAVTGVLFTAGIWICGRSSEMLGAHDHGGIVWDEIVGFLVTMGLGPSGWPWVIAGFVLFRVFDIAKPWPIGLLDRRIQGGLGIMLDDMLAGAFALIGLQVLSLLFR